MNELRLLAVLIALAVCMGGTMMECHKHKHRMPLLWTYLFGVLTPVFVYLLLEN